MADTPASLPFTIDLEGTRGTMTVDGHDITNQVRCGTVSFGDGDLPRLSIDLVPRAGRIEGEGIIEVSRHEFDTDEGRRAFYDLVEEQIRHIDPDQVRAMAEARLTSMGDDPYAATVEAVADLFRAAIERAGA